MYMGCWQRKCGVHGNVRPLFAAIARGVAHRGLAESSGNGEGQHDASCNVCKIMGQGVLLDSGGTLVMLKTGWS